MRWLLCIGENILSFKYFCSFMSSIHGLKVPLRPTVASERLYSEGCDSYRVLGPATSHQKHSCRVAIRGGSAILLTCQNLPKPTFSASIFGGKIFQETGKLRLFAVPGKNEGLNLEIWGWLSHLDSLGRCHQLKNLRGFLMTTSIIYLGKRI